MPTTRTVPALRSSLALHAQLAGADRTRGVVWSPYSVASAVGLAAAGARGATYDEIARVLAPEGNPTAVAAALMAAAVMSPPRHAWEAVGQIAVVTTLWAASDLPINARGWALGQIQAGTSLNAIQQLLGHRSLHTTASTFSTSRRRRPSPKRPLRQHTSRSSRSAPIPRLPRPPPRARS
jgi:hypothetical protein